MSLKNAIILSEKDVIDDFPELIEKTQGALLQLGYRQSLVDDPVLVQDSKFIDYYEKLKEIVPIGIVWYSQAISEEEIDEEVEYIYSKIKNIDIKLPIYILSESFDSETETGRADKLTNEERSWLTVYFCEKIKELGYIPGIYCDVSWYMYHNGLDWSTIAGDNEYSILVSVFNDTPIEAISRYDGEVKLQDILTEDGNITDDKVKIGYFITDYGFYNNNITPDPEDPDKPDENPFALGNKVVLDKAKIYPRWGSKKESDIRSGVYYIYNESIKNGRIRITYDKSNIDIPGLSVGWVNIFDITPHLEIRVGDKVIVNGKLNKYADGSGTDIEKNEEIMYVVDIMDPQDYQYNLGLANSKNRVPIGWGNKSFIVRYEEIYGTENNYKDSESTWDFSDYDSELKRQISFKEGDIVLVNGPVKESMTGQGESVEKSLSNKQCLVFSTVDKTIYQFYIQLVDYDNHSEKYGWCNNSSISHILEEVLDNTDLILNDIVILKEGKYEDKLLSIVDIIEDKESKEITYLLDNGTDFITTKRENIKFKVKEITL